MRIIVYVVDCLRADHLSCYGYHRHTTPSIDALARDGVLFEKAYSPSTWTRPAAASLLTSLYPPAHGVRTREDVFTRHLRTLPELLKQHGYTTLAISAIGNVSSSLGFRAGFDHFIDLYKAPFLRSKRPLANVKYEKLHHERQGEVVFPLAEDINEVLFPWMEENIKENLFVFLWDMDPHDPYMPPEDWRVYVDPEYRGNMDGSRELAKQARRQEDLQHLVNLYDGEIAYTDFCFGRLVEYLVEKGVYDETLIVVLGDHGEAFGDHGYMIHGHLPFEEIVRVPLVIKFPNQSYAGQRISGLVSLLDLMPTILDLAGIPRIEWEPLIQGRGFMGILNGQQEYTHQMVFSETQATEANNIVYSLRTQNWKYIWIKPPHRGKRIKSLSQALRNASTLAAISRNPLFYLKRQVVVTREHLYNMVDDPEESNNLARKMPQIASECQEAIKKWLRECVELVNEYEELERQPEVDEATLEHLRALGYID